MQVTPEIQAAMLQAARAARAQAYAPYSKFSVGAAVLDEHDRIHAGCNVENAAFPQGLCAEAGAISAMVAAGGRKVMAVVVVGVASEPVTPCGACRQKLREFAAPDTPIWVANETDVQLHLTQAELLPFSFGPHHLPERT